MCVGVVGRVLSVDGADLARMADVDVAGTVRRIGLLTLPEADVGDLVVIHAGFAVSFAAD